MSLSQEWDCRYAALVPCTMDHVNFQKWNAGEGVDWSHNQHQTQPNTAGPMPTTANPDPATHSWAWSHFVLDWLTCSHPTLNVANAVLASLCHLPGVVSGVCPLPFDVLWCDPGLFSPVAASPDSMANLGFSDTIGLDPWVVLWYVESVACNDCLPANLW